MKKILLASVAVATLVASPAFARTPTKHQPVMTNDTLVAAPAYAGPAYANSGLAVVGGVVVGRDPDAFIRNELVRDAFSYQN
jgi:hypothetical protein